MPPALVCGPPQASQLAILTANMLGKRLESLRKPLLERRFQHNKRRLIRALHRNEHLDQVDAFLGA